jgi:hypothetical protein
MTMVKNAIERSRQQLSDVQKSFIYRGMKNKALAGYLLQ